MSGVANNVEIRIHLDHDPPQYHPADTLRAEIEVASQTATRLAAIEWSVVWYTMGKGDEDVHVHEFFRRTEATMLAANSPFAFDFQTTLPASPLSYAGRIVKVCWAIRVRVFFEGGRQATREMPLQLGSIAPAAVLEDPTTPA